MRPSVTPQEQRDPLTERIPMTRAGYEKLEQELRQLKSVERPRIVREIEAARAHGDISENAEFHAAKERQSHLEGRVRLLEDRLARAQVIDPTGQTPDKVRFGVTVDLEDVESGERVTYQILGEEESDVAQGRISVTSPVARALLGKEVGDSVSVRVPKGTREFEILDIRFE
jgi:transcription elongation factor GreA